MLPFFRKFQQKKESAGSFKNLLYHTAFTLTFTSGLSYALGLLRDRTFAQTFGASSTLDVYNAAFVVPDLFLAVFAVGALSAAFVPIFTQLDKENKEKAITYTNQILNLCLIILVVVSGIFALILPYVVDQLVPGFSPEQQHEYIHVTRLMLLSPLFFTLSNMFGNVLISLKEFLWYGLSPALYNLGIIIGVLLFAPHFQTIGIVMGTILGAFLHLLVRVPSMIRYGYRPQWTLGFTPAMKETAWLMLPKIAQLAMWQLMLWWFVRLTSQLPTGSTTIYSFARNFQSVPVSLVGIAISLAAFAELSTAAAEKKYRKFGEIIKSRGIKTAVYTGLAGGALALFSYPVIKLLLGGGEFDETAIKATAMLLMVYTISIPFESGMHLLARAHYALKNTQRPSLIHVSTIAVTMGVSAMLLDKVGLYAIPIGFTSGLVIQIGLLTISLYQLLRSKSLKAKLEALAE